MTIFPPQPRLPERRRRGRLGLFGQMRLDELAPRHRAGAEPGAQPVEKLGERTGALGLVRANKTKGSVKTRRKSASWNTQFLLEILQMR